MTSPGRSYVWVDITDCPDDVLITLRQADCLIAATALDHGTTLATGNPKDFPMPDLSAQHWPVGE